MAENTDNSASMITVVVRSPKESKDIVINGHNTVKQVLGNRLLTCRMALAARCQVILHRLLRHQINKHQIRGTGKMRTCGPNLQTRSAVYPLIGPQVRIIYSCVLHGLTTMNKFSVPRINVL